MFCCSTLARPRTTLQREKENHLFSSPPLPPAQKTFRSLYATLHVRWLPPIFNCISCNYWAATQDISTSENLSGC